MSQIDASDQFFHGSRNTGIGCCLWTHPAALQCNRQMLLLILIYSKNNRFKMPGKMGKTVANLGLFDDIFQAQLLTSLFQFMCIFNNRQTPETTPKTTIGTLLPEPVCTGLDQQDLSRAYWNRFFDLFERQFIFQSLLMCLAMLLHWTIQTQRLFWRTYGCSQIHNRLGIVMIAFNRTELFCQLP